MRHSLHEAKKTADSGGGDDDDDDDDDFLLDFTLLANFCSLGKNSQVKNQDLSHLVCVINIVILSDLHISSFAQSVLGYPLRCCHVGHDRSRPYWLPMMHRI